LRSQLRSPRGSPALGVMTEAEAHYLLVIRIALAPKIISADEVCARWNTTSPSPSRRELDHAVGLAPQRSGRAVTGDVGKLLARVAGRFGQVKLRWLRALR
jgi:hypothetical protein